MLDALRAGEPLPNEMRVHLAFAFEYLCKGIAYDLLTPVKRPGGREAPIATHAQKEAIRYLRWCEDGRIQDANAVRSVANAYDVEERTVRGWRTKWKNNPTPELFEECGDSGECGDTEKDTPKSELIEKRRAKVATDLMNFSGGAYRRFIPKPTPKR